MKILTSVIVTAVWDKKAVPFKEQGMRHFLPEIAFLFIHPLPALVHLISDNIAPICAEQSERKPFLVAALDGLSFSWPCNHNDIMLCKSLCRALFPISCSGFIQLYCSWYVKYQILLFLRLNNTGPKGVVWCFNESLRLDAQRWLLLCISLNCQVRAPLIIQLIKVCN